MPSAESLSNSETSHRPETECTSPLQALEDALTQQEVEAKRPMKRMKIKEKAKAPLDAPGHPSVAKLGPTPAGNSTDELHGGTPTDLAIAERSRRYRDPCTMFADHARRVKACESGLEGASGPRRSVVRSELEAEWLGMSSAGREAWMELHEAWMESGDLKYTTLEMSAHLFHKGRAQSPAISGGVAGLASPSKPEVCCSPLAQVNLHR
jgi:hypothetical protein